MFNGNEVDSFKLTVKIIGRYCLETAAQVEMKYEAVCFKINNTFLALRNLYV